MRIAVGNRFASGVDWKSGARQSRGHAGQRVGRGQHPAEFAVRGDRNPVQKRIGLLASQRSFGAGPCEQRGRGGGQRNDGRGNKDQTAHRRKPRQDW